MRAILEFDLPKDQYDFDCARTGNRWQSEMRAFDQWLRAIEKHGGEPPFREVLGRPVMVEEAWQASVAAVRQEFWRHVADAGGFAEDS